MTPESDGDWVDGMLTLKTFGREFTDNKDYATNRDAWKKVIEERENAVLTIKSERHTKNGTVMVQGELRPKPSFRGGAIRRSR